MKIKPLTIAEVEYTAFKLAEEFMIYDEPIPDFGSRFSNTLESCLLTPFGQFSRKDLYRGLVGKASILFYLMIKNHPFQNGNKRIAVMTMLVFLAKNGKWLSISNEGLYKFAVRIAEGDSKQKNVDMNNIKNFFNQTIINL
jgi:death-on-curing family protein